MTVQMNIGTDNTLYLKADLKSSSRIDIKPLVIPQPKQDIPKIFLNGHSETENNFVKIKSTAKNTHPTPKECMVCIFLMSLLFLGLNQRLTIAVSETARQN